jgi:hypothetical protein
MVMTDFIAAIPEIDKQYGPFDAAVGTLRWNVNLERH